MSPLVRGVVITDTFVSGLQLVKRSYLSLRKCLWDSGLVAD